MWAVIDIGSNTIRLVIYSMEEGHPHSMLNKKYAVGLAGYIDKSNRIQPEGVSVLLEVLSDIAKILSYVQTQGVFPFATAALRNSDNGAEIISLIREKCGMDVRVLSGEEEAVFDYYGAKQDGLGERGLLTDVGGGSTELTYFSEGRIVAAESIPLGSLNLYKSYVSGLFPTQKEMGRIKKQIDRHLNEVSFANNVPEGQPVYSVGGTARSALKLMKARYGQKKDREFTPEELRHLISDVEEEPKQLMRSILRSSPDRIHTMIPGLLLFQSVAKHFSSGNFSVCGHGVREGYLMHCLREGGYGHG